MKAIFSILFCCLCLQATAQDSSFIKVHFLYGSKPSRAYKSEEQKWFGGKLGGHAGIEGDSGRVLNFLFRGKFHIVASKHQLHSAYTHSSIPEFYGILGGHPDSMKKAIVYVPVSAVQKRLFDSISTAYLRQVPYDYAFLGMRCGAATYEILGQLGILPAYSISKTYKKIFYPRKLRKRLLAEATANGWLVERKEGTARRTWEQD